MANDVKRYMTQINWKQTPLYQLWKTVKKRCKSVSFLAEYPSYAGCSLHPDFEDFQLFAKWVERQRGYDLDDWHLDKDILVKGNKVYGPDTCAFVPIRLNCLFVRSKTRRGDLPIGVGYSGTQINPYISRLRFHSENYYLGNFKTPELAFSAYKKQKEVFIKQEAEAFRAVIRPDVYAAMMNYQVEITD